MSYLNSTMTNHMIVFSHTLSDPEKLPWSNRIEIMVFDGSRLLYARGISWYHCEFDVQGLCLRAERSGPSGWEEVVNSTVDVVEMVAGHPCASFVIAVSLKASIHFIIHDMVGKPLARFCHKFQSMHRASQQMRRYIRSRYAMPRCTIYLFGWVYGQWESQCPITDSSMRLKGGVAETWPGLNSAITLSEMPSATTATRQGRKTRKKVS